MAGYSLSRRRAIALLSLTCLLLITLDIRGNSMIDSLKSGFGRLIAPLEDAGRAVGRPVRNAWRSITSYDDLASENERLRELVDQGRGASIAADATLREYQELRNLVGLDTLAGYPQVVAEVIGGSPQNFQQTIEINRGARDGIREGMPVVNAAGLVGKITKVFLDRSVVLLITDPSYAVTVKVVSQPGEEHEVPRIEPPPPTTTTLAPPDPSQPPLTFIDPATGSTVTLPPDFALPDGFGQDLEAVLTPTTSPAVPTTLDPSVTIPPGGVTTTSPPDTTIVPDTTVAPGDPTSSSSTTTTTVPADTGIRETGALEGQGPDELPRVRFISRDVRADSIRVGDLVSTAGGSVGLASLAPPNIQIGRVVRVIDRPSSAGPELEVDPVVDFRRLNFLIVLRYVPPTEVPAGAGVAGG
jgi:rod shape-determining protein MreC